MRLLALWAVGVMAAQPVAAQVGIGTTVVDASALLHLQSTDRGLLLPRLANPGAVAAPVAGLLIYDQSSNQVLFYNGSAWVPSSSQWVSGAGNVISYTAGNVGIGTTAPTEDLTIVGSANGDGVGIRIENNGTGNQTAAGILNLHNGVQMALAAATNSSGDAVGLVGTQSNHPVAFNVNGFEAMRIAPSGNVGIGTTSNPGLSLVVQRETGVTAAALNNFGGTGAALLLMRSNGTFAAPLPTTAGQAIGSVTFQGQGASGGAPSYVVGALISASAASNFAGTTGSANLLFATNDGTTTQPRMYIQSNGEVTIGSPAQTGNRLTVQGTAQLGMNGTSGALRLYSEQGATDYTVSFAPSATMTANVAYTLPANAGTNGQVLTTNGAGVLSWGAAASGSQWTTAGSDIHFATGNVGIGTTNTSLGRLHVDGNLYLSTTVSSQERRIEVPPAPNTNDPGSLVIKGGNATVGPQARVGGSVIIEAGHKYDLSTAGNPGNIVLRSGGNLAASGSAPNSGDFIWQAGGLSSSFTEVMRLVGPTGRLGIGTSSPLTTLDVRGAASALAYFQTENTVDRSSLITLQNNNTTPIYWQVVVGGAGNGLGLVNGELYLAPNVSQAFVLRNGTSSAETFRVTGAGNVGIGTPTPSERLTVNGNIAYTNAGVLQPEQSTTANGFNLLVSGGTPAQTVSNDLGGTLTLQGGNANVVSAGTDVGGNVRIMGGDGEETDGNVILAHDGTNGRGNVGIGLSNPSLRLQVTDNNVNGTVSINNTAATLSGPVLSVTANAAGTMLSASNNAAGGVGVVGASTNAAGSGRGVTGTANSLQGHGVVGYNGGSLNTGTIGSGVFGYTETASTAGGIFTNTAASGAALLVPQGRVGIGTSAPNAPLEVNSTTGGILLPRMTAAQRTAIAAPLNGLIVYQMDGVPGIYQYTGGAWALTTNPKIAFSATNPGGGSTTYPAGTEFIVEFDGEIYDYGNCFNPATYTFTAPVAGVYHFDAAFIGSNTMTSLDGSITISLSTAGGAYYTRRAYSAPGPDPVLMATLSTDLELAAGETVQVRVDASAAGTYGASQFRPRFSGHLVFAN